eukprot:CAMPEP_0168742318 /NCGR_PEP_ID=MMETSP0724-20121128/12973_1 /TAXON_ID=265536 /ORGANISM="Amphiprora sp., Strain CCMP467" /LENGTH=655 /DNA_ID=CAMNT_0008789861 /DNA_START=77 /DNA_END=2044 /DNA_ORIENTATION=+
MVGRTKAAKEDQSIEAAKNNCSAFISNALVDAGVTVVYGGHGGALAPLVNAIVDHPGLQWVCCRNEANASLMAAAHAKYTHQLACVVATSGPGATNLTTGLMEANLDQVPVLCLTGLKPRQGMHFSEFQDVDQSRLFAAAGCELSADVASPEALVPLLRDAVAVATTRNKCAHLAIPVDIQAAPCPIPVDKPFCAAHAEERIAPIRSNCDENTLNEIAQSLSVETKKVLIAIGVRAVDAGDDILKLAEHLRAPIVTRLHSKGAVDELHPLVLGIEGVHGKPGLETSAILMETADVVLNFGIDDCTLLVCNTAGLQVREMIEFQSSALMVSTRFRASYTSIGDFRAVARGLLECLKTQGGRRFSSVEQLQLSIGSEEFDAFSTSEEFSAKDSRLVRAQIGATDLGRNSIRLSNERVTTAAKLWGAVHSGAWIGKLHNLDEMEHALLLEQSLDKTHVGSKEGSTKYPHPGHVLMEVSRHLNKDIAVCIDTGDVTLWAGLCLKLKGGSRTLSSEHLGTMGYGTCAGIASILSREGPATSLVLVGDGGFQMTLQELATFQQSKRPGDRLIVIVIDNRLLGRVIFGFDGAKGCELMGPDFCELGKAYGGHGYRLDDAVAIGEHVRDAEPGLTILHVPIDPTVKADMATFKDGASKMVNSG